MPKFIHERSDVEDLFKIVADKQGLLPFVIEKDYWVMHCLWGLLDCGLNFEMKGGTSLSKGWGIINRFSEDIDIKFEPSEGLNTRGEKAPHIEARKKFFDKLTKQIRIPHVFVERDKKRDDKKFRGVEIMLKYKSLFDPVPGIKPWVLLEVGFDTTRPNKVLPVTSWAMEYALNMGVEVMDNKASGVAFFVPEYTFVDKIQTVCKKFRQFEADPLKYPPKEFMRHYYDLYMLLDQERINEFIGSEEYKKYCAKKLRGADKKEFEKKDALIIPDGKVYAEFKSGYDAMKDLLFREIPTFDAIRDRIATRAKDF